MSLSKGNLLVDGIRGKAVDETPLDSHHSREQTEGKPPRHQSRASEPAVRFVDDDSASSDLDDENCSARPSVDDQDDDSDENKSDNSLNGSGCTTMFKRFRLRRSSEGDDVERNEHGLVTRVRSSLKTKKRSAAGVMDTSPAPPLFATICINNVNRSMQAHRVLRDAGLRVRSFGAGVQVCFPGRKIDTPRLFGYGTTYETMYNKLREEDEELYKLNGVLEMLQRNMSVKSKPERFQLLLNKQLEELDVVVCLDYTMFIQVLNDIRMRIRFSFHKKRLHVVCLEVEDTPQGAQSGGQLTLELCEAINALPDLSEAAVKQVVVAFEKRHQLEMFYVGLSV